MPSTPGSRRRGAGRKGRWSSLRCSRNCGAHEPRYRRVQSQSTAWWSGSSRARAAPAVAVVADSGLGSRGRKSTVAFAVDEVAVLSESVQRRAQGHFRQCLCVDRVAQICQGIGNFRGELRPCNKVGWKVPIWSTTSRTVGDAASPPRWFSWTGRCVVLLCRCFGILRWLLLHSPQRTAAVRERDGSCRIASSHVGLGSCRVPVGAVPRPGSKVSDVTWESCAGPTRR